MLLEFVGCYKDQRSRTLNEKDTKSSSMTVDKCRKTCTSLKYKYYGVEVRTCYKITNTIWKTKVSVKKIQTFLNLFTCKVL